MSELRTGEIEKIIRKDKKMNNEMPELKAGDLIKDETGWCLMIDSKNGYALTKDVGLDVSCVLKGAPDKVYRAPEGEVLTRTTLMELVTEGREVPKYLYWERPEIRG